MYNNALIHTSYKPYVPLPKKQVNKDGNGEQKPTTQTRVINPNDYSGQGQQQRSSSDSFAKAQVPVTKININQLLIDFKSTLNAIGASEDVENEVKTYLGLIEHQSKKEVPNKKMIISNLKIAADVLDTYISDTLNKPSTVVKDWVDALLLQNIDFKADPTITKGAFESITGEQPQTAKLAEKKLAQKQQKIQEEPVVSQEQPEIAVAQTIEENIPQVQEMQVAVPSNENSELSSLIAQATSILDSSPQQALKTLSQAFILAQETQDKEAMANIYSSIAEAQNNMNNIPQALECLNASTILAYSLGLDALKTRNHKLMAELYNEAGFSETAIDHYFVSLSIDGKLEDTDNQADTLKQIGDMYANQYEKDEAISYYKDALELAKVTENINIMSSVFLSTADTFKNAGIKQKAISNYKNAAKLSQKIHNDEDLYSIYEKAGDLMLEMNCQRKAADLYKKSYRIAQKLQNDEAQDELRKKLIALNS